MLKILLMKTDIILSQLANRGNVDDLWIRRLIFI